MDDDSRAAKRKPFDALAQNSDKLRSYIASLRVSMRAKATTCQSFDPPNTAKIPPTSSKAMNKHLYIITGASRGMGLGIAEQLLAPNHILLCVSRKTNAALAANAASKGVSLEQWPQDLSDGAFASDRLHDWLRAQNATQFASATLINNAALLPKIAPLREVSYLDIAAALRVGLESVMQLTAAFLHGTNDWQAARKVLNISSGNGRRAMPSQATYSAVKAGMDHFSRVVALEEAANPTGNGAKIVSLAPGIIDTDMQTQLRDADPAAFPDQSVFINFKTNGDLLTPEAAAKRVLAYLSRIDFGADAVADVRDA
jgi:benzil reductase ((S)-benzoin forming)